MACALAAAAAGAAEPAPVQAGLWDVRLLTTFERTTQRAEAAPAPRARSYRICIAGDRARAPMLPKRLPASAELLFDRESVSGSYSEPTAEGMRHQVEFSYRRLDATAFEGSLDRAAATQVTRTQYFARHVARDCGTIAPTPPSAAGEP